MRIVILGGTRFLGRRVAELLRDRGLEVVVAHRGRTGEPPEGTTSVSLDRETGAGLDAVARLRAEAVVDLSAYRADWVKRALEAFGDRCPHYVFVSSGAVYRAQAELPWPESTPFGPLPIWGQYGHEKLAAERALWEADAAGTTAVTVVRLPFVMGPGNYADREAFVCSRILAGRPLLLSGGGSSINQFVHVDDAAAAIVAIVEQPDRSGGEAFNCGYRSAITNRGFVELCADVLGHRAEIVAIDEEALGVSAPVFDLTDLVFPFPDEHYYLDASRIAERLGLELGIDHRTMLEQFVAGWRAGEPASREPVRYGREERALAALGR